MISRPPPLQLHIDNMLPNMGLPTHIPRSFFDQVYDLDWRKVVIALALVNCIRYGGLAHVAFEDEYIDDDTSFSSLSDLSFALGVMYAMACMIEVWGVLSVVIRHPLLIRLYAYLSLVNALLVSIAGGVACVGYFGFADDIVRQCILLASEGRLKDKSTFQGPPWDIANALSMADAEKHCLSSYDLNSPTPILATFLFHLLPATLYYLLVYTYYCQTVDMWHPANLLRARRGGRRSAIRMEEMADSPLMYVKEDNADRWEDSGEDTIGVSPGPPSFNQWKFADEGGIPSGAFALGSASSLTESTARTITSGR